MNIILDFDGCIVNTIKRIVDMYNQDHNDNVDWHTVKSWGFKECTKLNNEVLNSYFAQQRFFNEELEFMPYAKEVIKELANTHKITVCSMGSENNLKYKEKWLNDNLGVYHKFIGVLESEYKDKSHIDMSGCVFIDDSAKNLETSNASVKICYGEVFPWNEFFAGESRLYQWHDFVLGEHSVNDWLDVCNVMNVSTRGIKQPTWEIHIGAEVR